MKAKLLKKIRRHYTYRFHDGEWMIYAKPCFPIAWAATTHKAVDVMASQMLALSQLIKWYRKVYRIHGSWGKFHIIKL